MNALGIAARIGAEALSINPLRTALSTLGVIIGVAALVSVLSLGDGMELTARERIAGTTGVLSIAVSSRTVESVDGDFFPLSDTIALGPDDVRSLSAIPGVAEVRMSARARREVRLAGEHAQRRMATVFALGESELAERAPAHGVVPANADTGGAPAVLLSHLMAARLTGGDPASLVGRAVLIGGAEARISGIEAPRTGEAVPGIMVRWEDAPGLLAAGRLLPQIAVIASSLEEVPGVQAEVERHLAGRTPSWRNRFEVGSYVERARQAAQGILIFKLLMGALTGISLLVGGIGIMNVLLASVSERTREIGIRRAAGATRRDIRLQFLSESVAISAFGSVIGIIAGLAAAFAVTFAIRRLAQATFVQASFSWSSLLAAAGAAILIGLAFGTYPARRASRLSPIDAIRHE